MKIRITSVEKGTHDEERVVMEVLEDCSLGYYIIADSTYNSETNKISNKVRHIKWFNNKEVRKGDNIILYTRVGTDSSSNKVGGGQIHFIFWNLNSNVWNNDHDKAVLINIQAWSTFIV